MAPSTEVPDVSSGAPAVPIEEDLSGIPDAEAAEAMAAGELSAIVSCRSP